ncbi:Spo0E like sporulation regulatory protein [Ureibacillus xyleni]|uniref:Spo0E like sporulation regulatory protein n=1 Tax=Ureibacillus xyleni TaxID=614648 RepID=A0A285SST1_9BACL|nr:aspartyl-phosphate phosphatase Spo0E family protein [Ureibacillus xyleni]SOC11087.1 Spo0E like sporulation regulatory protein [Ureibacillus xyleni]
MESIIYSTMDLENEIYNLRKRMIEMGRNKGLLHPETIKCSQELDEIMNQFQNVKPN